MKISVIIPVYNTEKYLKECLNSILAQTLKDIEIICVDDGSTDSCPKILDKYSQKDSRIKIIRQKNQGAGNSRNNALKKATGEFVAFLDSDDAYPSNDVLECLYNAAKQNHVLICGGGFSNFTDNINQTTMNYDERLDGYLFEKDGLINYRDYQFDYGYHRFIYNRNFLLDHKIFYPDYRRFQDPPFFVKAMLTAQKFYALHKTTYAHRLEHEHPRWSARKTHDLLKGIFDNMKLAHTQHLEKLNKYSFYRFEENYPRIENFLNKKTLQIILDMQQYNDDIKKFISDHIKAETLPTKIFSIRSDFQNKHIIIRFFGLKIKLKK